jgi:hypothetical protein
VALRAIADSDPIYAIGAVRVVGRVGGAAARDRLREVEKRETRVTVRAAIEQVLERPH